MQTLVKLVDPMRAREEEAAQEAERNRPPRQTAGDVTGFVCRVCGETSDEGSYCPRCLADTMEPVPTPR